MEKGNKNLISENIIYLIFWVLIFVFPVLLSAGGNRIDWVRVLHEFIRILPFFLLFLVNNNLLFDYLRDKKYFRYFGSALFAIVFFSFTGVFHNYLFDLLGLSGSLKGRPRMDLMWKLNTFFYNFVFSVLGVGFNNAIKITIGWLDDMRKFEQLQKEHVRNRLTLLQHQISPHFFMNTLNNIHALIDLDREIAKNSVVKLSQMMRVLLYENEYYSLKKEIEFINGYLELMRIRVNRNVEIRFDYPANVPDISFPPLLLISFVENSFKHGIKAVGKSFVNIQFKVDNGNLLVSIVNSVAAKIQTESKGEKIGMQNTVNRLSLLYGDCYSCDISETDESYSVNLKIPL